MYTSRKFVFLMVWALCFCSALKAQKENNIWYFGSYIGLDFNTTPPTPLYDGEINTPEGCSSVSDEFGNLLFYTDGSTVWNKNHQTMDNGNGLYGNFSCSQSCVAVKKPGSNTEYYIFTPDTRYIKTYGINYSVVDMAKNNGLGKVIEKNTNLYPKRSTEKITIAKDAFCTGYWLVTRPANGDKFYTYHITAAGIDTTPVISKSGMFIDSNSNEQGGYLKVSPQGNKLVICNNGSNFEVHDFNPATGTVSGCITITTNEQTYGCSFSPNGKLLYITLLSKNELYQYDVSVSNITAIKNSEVLIAKGVGLANVLCGIQIGSDGIIYVTRNNSKWLSAVTKPDVGGTGCNFVDSAIVFSGTKSIVWLGLPNFIDNPIPFVEPLNLGPDTFFCAGQQIVLKPQQQTKGPYLWSTGDTTAQISIDKGGIYWLKTTTSCGLSTDTITVINLSDSVTNINLGNDTIICGNEFYLKVPPRNALVYQWSTGEKTDSIKVTSNGIYWVAAKTACGIATDTIQVGFVKEVINPIGLGNDTVVCGTTFPLFTSPVPNAEYLWSTGDTTTAITVIKTGNYWVQAKNYCYNQSDNIFVELVQDSVFAINLPNDTLLCNTLITLDAGKINKAKYLWNTGDTTQTLTVNKSGNYNVTATTYGCNTKLKDSTRITIFTTTPLHFPNDTDICSHRFKGFDLSPAKGAYNRYLWSTGSTDSVFVAQQPGFYSLTVHDTCGNTYNDDIQITVTDCHCELYVPNAFTPNSDGDNDLFFVNEYCGLGAFYLRIFNRWGELLFESTTPHATWDGTFKGQQVPEGVYLVMVHYTFTNLGTQPDYAGNLTIMR